MFEPNEAPRAEVYTLPSGACVDLLNLNARSCRTRDDASELRQILQSKIIDIEFQLECSAKGYFTNGSRVDEDRDHDLDPIWEPRARKALAITKMHKDAVQHEYEKLREAEVAEKEAREQAKKEAKEAEKLAKHKDFASRFVDVAKTLIDPVTFGTIKEIAARYSDAGTTPVSEPEDKPKRRRMA